MLNVLRVIPSMNPSNGGPSEGIRNSIAELRNHSISNEVVCLDDPGAAYLKKEDFTIHALGEPKGRWAYHRELIKWLQRNISRFDVVIIHGLWLFPGYAFTKAWRSLKGKSTALPTVYVMPHGMLDPYFQQAKGRKIKALRNWIYWKIIEQKLVNNADGVLFTTQDELELARKTFSPYHPKAEINIGYGIKSPAAYSDPMRQAFHAKCNIAPGKKYWLFLSRIHPKKGVELLIAAYKRLLMEKKELPLLVIAGPGIETSYGEQLKNMAADTDIYFPGMLAGDEKWGAFYGAELFVLPSHQENFGIAVVEALACGKPVLISDKVNIWKQVKEEGAGLIEDDTEEGTYQLLRKWIELSEEEKRVMKGNARIAFDNKFSVTRSGATLAQLLASARKIK